ncbi:MAG: FAD-dependent oxidoreductase, partial [Verrucomicrobiales bacterium]
MTADVLVIGGGSAGLAAAVTAARSGAVTVLVERHGMLGGMGTASLVHTFCGLYLLDGDRPEIANPGIAAEVAERMQRAAGVVPVKMGRCWVLPQHPVEFASLADGMVAEAGVEVLFHSELVALEEGWRARVMCRGESLEIKARSLIDTSGDAVVAAMLGGADLRAPSERLQRPAYVCGVLGVEGELNSLALSGRLVEGWRAGVLPKAALGMHFRMSGRQG